MFFKQHKIKQNQSQKKSGRFRAIPRFHKLLTRNKMDLNELFVPCFVGLFVGETAGVLDTTVNYTNMNIRRTILA